MILLIIIGGLLILFGCYLFLKALWKIVLAIYYWKFANGKNIDEGFKKYVIAKTPEYAQFKKNIDKGI